MKITSDNLNFKGYKNFIGSKFEHPDKSAMITTMNVQLNNRGTRDLDNYRQILKLMGYKDNTIKRKNVMHCLYLEYNNMKNFLFNETPLYNGNELKQISKELSPVDFDKLEKTNLKAYSFLADITKRIMEDDLIKYDSRGYYSTIAQCIDMFKKYFPGQSKRAFEFLNNCTSFYSKPKDIAKTVNEGVNVAIKNYLK